MDEMSRDDKINKIISYMRVLLIHLIKQVVEKRSTRSWEDSIDESLDSIAATNKRRSSGGYYLDDEALALALTEAWSRALRRASREAFEGIYAVDHLATQVDREALLETALRQIKERQGTIA
jgi:4-hydroxyphenylpyruvate dioxygenase-like putative hemolysin